MARLAGITIAAVNMRQMARFYNAALDARLKPTLSIGDAQFYAGKVGEIELTLCPNEIAGVSAEQNRQQLRFEVADIEAVMRRGLACHGIEINPVDEYQGAKVASLADPDGNTIEFAQPLS